MPTSPPTIPAKIMSSHALTKNIGPAATSLKNASMTNLHRHYVLSCRSARIRFVVPGDQLGPGVLKASRDHLEQPPGELVSQGRIGRAAVPDGVRVELERTDLGDAHRPDRPLVRRGQPGPAHESANADSADDRE